MASGVLSISLSTVYACSLYTVTFSCVLVVYSGALSSDTVSKSFCFAVATLFFCSFDGVYFTLSFPSVLWTGFRSVFCVILDVISLFFCSKLLSSNLTCFVRFLLVCERWSDSVCDCESSCQ